MNYRESIKQHLQEQAEQYERDLQKQITEAKQAETERKRVFKAKAERARSELLHKERLQTLLSDNLSSSRTDLTSDNDISQRIGQEVMKRIRKNKHITPDNKESELPLIIESSKSTDLIKSKGHYQEVKVVRANPYQQYNDLELLSQDQLKSLIEDLNGDKIINMNSKAFREAVRASKKAS
ncbi:hypothetical protein [Neptuniibacter caesariensis]|uniref:Uncharacterized protein n=1 Tax=Neptuniibacter caesariensis TaxID=207954 RepID=A0A7U8GU48_NEPCE|nr:hypothetical protein [Neptuniibacter caesariensis]EAR62962.1 hypothetical protein MED92_07581 [Oceanospirillum sp. MED92] [Neptuniibacter caesariensis]